MRVLLVEDDSATATSISMMLQAEGFVCDTTDLGEEGIDLGKIYDYDIILLDLNLPDMSGFEVLRSLRVSKVKTPILILSGLAGIEDKVKGLGFGADHVTDHFPPVPQQLMPVHADAAEGQPVPAFVVHDALRIQREIAVGMLWWIVDQQQMRQADRLGREIQSELEQAAARTADNTGMLFNIALSYGGRAEIVDAARRAIRARVSPDDLDEATFESFLYTAGQPDPDLLIRTSGEQRLSDFLPWETAYAELYFTTGLWPDFDAEDLAMALHDFQSRDRRFVALAPDHAAARVALSA